MNESSHLAVLEVRYPDAPEWDVAAFEQLRDSELEAIRKKGEDYDRENWFRQDPYFRYFRKFKKTYPVMMQVESFLLKGRPFPEGRYINAVAFLTEMKTRILMGTHDADRVGRIHAIADERRRNDMHLALEALGETGADRTVDHARSQRALLGRTGLTLEITARDATDCVHLLDVVDGQREEVVILFLAGNDSRHEYGSVALTDEHCTRRLLGELARLEAVFLAIKFELLNDFFHVCSTSSFSSLLPHEPHSSS